MSKTIHLPVLVVLALLVGCGDGDASEPAGDSVRVPEGASERAAETAKKPARRGTKIVLGDSEFGRMLFNSSKQAIYIFERDKRNRTNCYGACAAAWPPVYTKGRPRAGKGVKQSFLGTIKRRDGRRQVTYAGQPLYYYVNEGTGEVECHNVFLNGGLWWVVGPDGKRRA
jgi:predicted lipoprotein with Yx(FWY)xxD motif